jgi:hypothetical protein
MDRHRQVASASVRVVLHHQGAGRANRLGPAVVHGLVAQGGGSVAIESVPVRDHYSTDRHRQRAHSDMPASTGEANTRTIGWDATLLIAAADPPCTTNAVERARSRAEWCGLPRHPARGWRARASHIQGRSDACAPESCPNQSGDRPRPGGVVR